MTLFGAKQSGNGLIDRSIDRSNSTRDVVHLSKNVVALSNELCEAKAVLSLFVLRSDQNNRSPTRFFEDFNRDESRGSCSEGGAVSCDVFVHNMISYRIIIASIILDIKY